MSDKLIVCIVILILSAIIAAILIIYLCALIAVTKAGEYQKNEEDIIRDPTDKLRRIPEGLRPGGQSSCCSQVCMREDSGSKNNRY